MIAFLLTPLARWVVVGVVVAALIGALVIVTDKNKALKAANAELTRANYELTQALEAEREGKERSDKARKMTPEELYKYWNQQQDEQELQQKGPDVLKKKALPCRLLLPSYTIG